MGIHQLNLVEYPLPRTKTHKRADEDSRIVIGVIQAP
jgi:hypothetical protein